MQQRTKLQLTNDISPPGLPSDLLVLSRRSKAQATQHRPLLDDSLAHPRRHLRPAGAVLVMRNMMRLLLRISKRGFPFNEVGGFGSEACGDNAQIDSQEALAQHIQPTQFVLEPLALRRPEEASRSPKPQIPEVAVAIASEVTISFIDQEAVELLAQIVAAALNLAQQAAEGALIVKTLDTRYVAVVALVLVDGAVGGVNEGQNLGGGVDVGLGVAGQGLQGDDGADEECGDLE